MRRAFTLIELLIVVFLIATLVALAVPAILKIRSASRQATCQNRQHELQLAIAGFEQAKNRLPGWRETLGRPGKTRDVSWAFLLLPHLGRNDLFHRYAPGGENASAEPTELVELFVCPEDVSLEASAPISYAVNCGLPDADDIAVFGRYDLPANGLFHDLRPPRGWQGKPLVQTRSTDIRDGAGVTLTLADRTEVVRWTDWQQERLVALWWQNTLAPHPEALVNGLKPPVAESRNLNHVRPSSGHSGGVVVGFADGANRFLSDQVDYLVYALLMTPDGARARQTDGKPVDEAFRKTALPEGALDE